MRGGKSFLALLAVALAIGAYAYFVESKRDVSDTTATKHDKVFSFDSSKIEQVQIKAAGGDLTTLKKNGTEWQIIAPETMEADQDAVSTIVTALSSLESTKTVDENPSAIKQFDLDPPRASVSVRLAGETTDHRLQLGTKTPTGADLYARVEGQPKVFLVGASVDDQLNRSTFDLREKRLLKFDREKADSLKLEPAGAPPAVLTKKGTDWRLTSPVDARSDSNAVDGIVSKLSQAKMKSIVTADGTKDLKKYGLDKPQTVATIGVGSTRASLAIGSKLDDGSLYARDLSRPFVFTVEATLLDDLKKKADDLRQKMLFDFRSFTAVSFDVTHGGQTFSFVKQKPAAAPDSSPAPAAETWKMTKPAAKDADQAKVTDFLVDVANLKADSFIDKAAASGDEVVFTARFGDEKAPTEERVTFRKSGTVVHGMRQGEPGAAIVPTADFDKVLNELTALTGGK
jgi:hypothetical protein